MNDAVWTSKNGVSEFSSGDNPPGFCCWCATNVWMNACNARIAPAAAAGLQLIMWGLWLSGAKAGCQSLIRGEL